MHATTAAAEEVTDLLDNDRVSRSFFLNDLETGSMFTYTTGAKELKVENEMCCSVPSPSGSLITRWLQKKNEADLSVEAALVMLLYPKMTQYRFTKYCGED